MAENSSALQPNAAQTGPDSRWHVLAGLRFLLAMVVVCGHLTWFQKPGETFSLALLGGTSAVLGFLIVSGYSIGHSLDRRPIGFFPRRVLRIYPLYLAAVLFALVPFLSGADALRTMDPLEIIERPRAWVVVGNLFMVQNLICPPIPSNMLLWTLGIEVICYAAAPLFRRTHTLILVIIIAASACAFGLLYPHLRKLGYGHYATLSWGLPLAMFAWAWIAGFLLHRYRNSILVGIAIAGLGFLLLRLNTEYRATYSVHCFIGSVLLVTLAPRIWLPRLVGGLLNYLGDLSYPVYLFHIPAFLLGYSIMNIENPWGLLIMALSISAAFLFIESILKPILGRIVGRDKIPTAG
jgi:peptidoglycan/LPS O-acetylase OafA/YrhL